MTLVPHDLMKGNVAEQNSYGYKYQCLLQKLCLTLPGRQSPSKCVGLATNLFIMLVSDF